MRMAVAVGVTVSAGLRRRDHGHGRLHERLPVGVRAARLPRRGGRAYSTAAGSFVATLEREWPAEGRGVRWLDEGRLLLPGDMSQVSGLARLDVDTGVAGSVPVASEHEVTRPLLVLPDGRQVRAVGWPTQEVLLHDGPRLVKRLMTIDCGHIESLVAAPTGRPLLVGVDRAAEELDRSPITGLPPCGGDSGAVTVVPGENEPYVEAW